jgi:hypothetical protein
MTSGKRTASSSVLAFSVTFFSGLLTDLKLLSAAEWVRKLVLTPGVEGELQPPARDRAATPVGGSRVWLLLIGSSST